MEEEKAAAYYDELCRKGEGAARFKQGLGFSSTSNDAVPSRGSALSSSSFFSKFVKASNPSDSKPDEAQKQVQLESVQNKLKKKPNEARTETSSRVSRDRDNGLSSRRSRSRSRDSARHSRRRSRSRSRDRNRDRHSRHRRRSRSRDSGRSSRRRSRSSSGDRDGRSRRRSRSRDDYRRRRGDRSGSTERSRRSRSESQHRRKSEKSNGDSGGREKKERNGGVDYAKLIEGYDKMTPAERVKAKMKLQLTETAEKDEIKGMGSGWERFNFDKDAPLDDEEIEAAEDDSELVKHIGQSFRFSAVEAKREEKIKAAHDEAMFGAPSLPPSTETDDEGGKYSKKEASLTSERERDFTGEDNMDTSQNAPVASLISDQVLTMQQGSWRDRIRKI